MEEKKCICPNCGVAMNPSNEDDALYVCPDCGCTIEGCRENFDSSGYCPNCNQSLEGNECPHCGYYLGSDFE